MATLRRRGNSWQATIKRKGHPLQIKTFASKAPAAAWARRIEMSMDNGLWIDTRGTRLSVIGYLVRTLESRC